MSNMNHSTTSIGKVELDQAMSEIAVDGLNDGSRIPNIRELASVVDSDSQSAIVDSTGIELEYPQDELTRPICGDRGGYTVNIGQASCRDDSSLADDDASISSDTSESVESHGSQRNLTPAAARLRRPAAHNLHDLYLEDKLYEVSISSSGSSERSSNIGPLYEDGSSADLTPEESSGDEDDSFMLKRKAMDEGEWLRGDWQNEVQNESPSRKRRLQGEDDDDDDSVASKRIAVDDLSRDFDCLVLSSVSGCRESSNIRADVFAGLSFHGQSSDMDPIPQRVRFSIPPTGPSSSSHELVASASFRDYGRTSPHEHRQSSASSPDLAPTVSSLVAPGAALFHAAAARLRAYGAARSELSCPVFCTSYLGGLCAHQKR